MWAAPKKDMPFLMYLGGCQKSEKTAGQLCRRTLWKLWIWSLKALRIRFQYFFIFISLSLCLVLGLFWLGAELTWQGLRGWLTGLLCLFRLRSDHSNTAVSTNNVIWRKTVQRLRGRRSRGPPSTLPAGWRHSVLGTAALRVGSFSPIDTWSIHGNWQKTARACRDVSCAADTLTFFGPNSYKVSETAGRSTDVPLSTSLVRNLLYSFAFRLSPWCGSGW